MPVSARAQAKFVYALWGSGLESVLRAPELRAELRAVGGLRLQVNVDDADVAAAKLRITTFDEPARAAVSVWAWADAVGAGTSIAERLAGAAERCAGWQVSERIPLPPPPTPDGVRCPALAQLAFLRIPAGLDPQEWRHRWQELHTSVAMATQATFGYVQNRVLTQVVGSERVDAIVEELFSMAAMTDVHAAYGSSGDDAELRRRQGLMIDSVISFGAHENLDVVPTSRYSYWL